ncbi:hypothetical protein PACTADRAFT_51669 [Pachysolen tannophilus NRRL Y-2460]|uniref:Transcription elongation factor 1 homolog n=1 Tax=Pachysolen tannophilus NRRL Y-2460 TaxID=669874 RepID=A0A1E4TQC3_PACTA|nr:hypothetical protein PACTADRAFT_51669 [Pachysolen tannophilus NRRL Y-2460]
MGKRKKSTRKPVKKVKEVLETQFSCLFCNHEKSVVCTLDKKNSVGSLHCKICGQNFQTPINTLSQPVDIYSDWVDACEAVAEEIEREGANADDFEVKDGYDDEDEDEDY